MTERRETRQERLKPLNIWERYREQHGEWFDKMKKVQAELADQEAIKPFDLTYATQNQIDAIRGYMKREGKDSLAAFMTWMRWNEKTFYDLLREVSP